MLSTISTTSSRSRDKLPVIDGNLLAKASAVLGGECVSRSRDVTANENAVIRLMEAEQEYAEAEREYGDLRSQVCSLLQRLDDPMNADILRLRYVEHKRMTDISTELHLSRTNTYYRHENALRKLESLIEA